MTRFSGVTKLFGYCSYCGTRTYGEACAAHRDLVQLERAPLQRTEPAPADLINVHAEASR